MVKKEIYDKWVKRFGIEAKQALDMQEAASQFEIELGRIFLTDIITHIKNKRIIFLSNEDWVLYTPKQKQNIMKLNSIISKNKKGSIMLEILEGICKQQQLPIIELLVIKGLKAEQWYYKKGFVKIGEQVSKSKSPKTMCKLQKKLFKIGLEQYEI